MVARAAQWLLGFGRFWYEFIVGDDWVRALAVVVALLATALLHGRGADPWWLAPAVVLVTIVISLRRSTIRARRAARRR